jgi:hypothetical protein
MGRVFRFAQRVAFCRGGLPWLAILILGMLALSSALVGQTSLGQTSLSQTSADQTSPDSEAVGPLPTDWSHHHLIFSSPGTEEQSNRVQQDARYRQQLARRSRSTLPTAEQGVALASELKFGPYPLRPRKTRKNNKLMRDWSENMGTGASVGAGQYPATFSAGATPSCANDFVVFNTGVPGSTTQPSIIAYNNLYSGCAPATVPSVLWAYNTGGTITTSATLSANGKQLAFVQAEGGVATLVLLTWKASTGTIAMPAAPTTEANGSYRGCPAPCMTTFTLIKGPTVPGATAVTDTNSSPYYDYSEGADADTLYVGDDTGYLHQFPGVFLGTTPTETNNANAGGTTGWPSRAATAPLSSPVFDSVSGNVFVTASWQQSVNSGGRLHAICVTTTCGAASTTTGTPFVSSKILGPANTGTGNTCNTPSSGNATNSTMRVDSPIIDSTAEMVYVFMGNDGTGSSAVYQFPTSQTSISLSCGTETKIGSVNTTNPDFTVFAGAFDNVYYTSANGGSPTGNLYVCGNTTGVPALYQVPITANVMATSGTSVAAASGANTSCSPLTEVFSATNSDLVFLGTEASGVSAACAGAGCLFNVQVTAWLPSTVYAVGQEVMDTHFQIQVVESVTGADKSGTTPPTWGTTTGGTITDNNVTWLNQGPLNTNIADAAFATSTAYTIGNLVVDPNGNIERCTVAGTSGTAQPTWLTAPGATTTSGGASFENLGASGTNAMAAAGGTSGIIIDNTASSVTEAGASEVYFSPLASQTCKTSGGTGGCAVQASQSALH